MLRGLKLWRERTLHFVVQCEFEGFFMVTILCLNISDSEVTQLDGDLAIGINADHATQQRKC